MIRLAAPTAGVALLLATGCFHNGERSVHNPFGLKNPQAPGKGPSEKDIMKMTTTADMAVRQRVNDLGRKILEQNTFTGLDPQFCPIGVKESVLFHVGSRQLIISQGLIEKCQTDAELAAVLCSELGQMLVEVRTAKALGREPDQVPDVTPEGSAQLPGGAPVNTVRQPDRTGFENRAPAPGSPAQTGDATSAARELLKGAGYSPAELDRVDSLLKLSPRSEQLRKMMAGSAPPPEVFQP
jgi:hypothetical protein